MDKLLEEVNRFNIFVIASIAAFALVLGLWAGGVFTQSAYATDACATGNFSVCNEIEGSPNTCTGNWNGTYCTFNGAGSCTGTAICGGDPGTEEPV